MGNGLSNHTNSDNFDINGYNVNIFVKTGTFHKGSYSILL